MSSVGDEAEPLFSAADESASTIDLSGQPDDFVALLESAARLQGLVPDAVMVGGSAAALYAHHRFSTDHDHVVAVCRELAKGVLR